MGSPEPSYALFVAALERKKAIESPDHVGVAVADVLGQASRNARLLKQSVYQPPRFLRSSEVRVGAQTWQEQCFNDRDANTVDILEWEPMFPSSQPDADASGPGPGPGPGPGSRPNTSAGPSPSPTGGVGAKSFSRGALGLGRSLLSQTSSPVGSRTGSFTGSPGRRYGASVGSPFSRGASRPSTRNGRVSPGPAGAASGADPDAPELPASPLASTTSGPGPGPGGYAFGPGRAQGAGPARVRSASSHGVSGEEERPSFGRDSAGALGQSASESERDSAGGSHGRGHAQPGGGQGQGPQEPGEAGAQRGEDLPTEVLGPGTVAPRADHIIREFALAAYEPGRGRPSLLLRPDSADGGMGLGGGGSGSSESLPLAPVPRSVPRHVAEKLSAMSGGSAYAGHGGSGLSHCPPLVVCAEVSSRDVSPGAGSPAGRAYRPVTSEASVRASWPHGPQPCPPSEEPGSPSLRRTNSRVRLCTPPHPALPRSSQNGSYGPGGGFTGSVGAGPAARVSGSGVSFTAGMGPANRGSNCGGGGLGSPGPRRSGCGAPQGLGRQPSFGARSHAHALDPGGEGSVRRSTPNLTVRVAGAERGAGAGGGEDSPSHLPSPHHMAGAGSPWRHQSNSAAADSPGGGGRRSSGTGALPSPTARGAGGAAATTSPTGDGGGNSSSGGGSQSGGMSIKGYAGGGPLDFRMLDSVPRLGLEGPRIRGLSNSSTAPTAAANGRHASPGPDTHLSDARRAHLATPAGRQDPGGGNASPGRFDWARQREKGAGGGPSGHGMLVTRDQVDTYALGAAAAVVRTTASSGGSRGGGGGGAGGGGGGGGGGLSVLGMRGSLSESPVPPGSPTPRLTGPRAAAAAAGGGGGAGPGGDGGGAQAAAGSPRAAGAITFRNHAAA